MTLTRWLAAAVPFAAKAVSAVDEEVTFRVDRVPVRVLNAVMSVVRAAVAV
jgi:hypothetical protein